jgi:RNA polymerase sigma factor (sigma-70 family)
MSALSQPLDEQAPPPTRPTEVGEEAHPDQQAAEEEADATLIEAVRAGDSNATAALYTRYHPSALRAARGIAGHGVAEDLVSEAFTKVLVAILHGAGPQRAFRPYLVATIRNLYVDGIRRSSREFLVGDPDVLDNAEPDGADAFVAHTVMVDALATLPPRWREILWRTVVIGEPLGVAAAKMGLNPNAAAALNFRARGGLLKAYRDRQERETGS